MGILARMTLAYLDTDEQGATHAIFQPSKGDQVEHKAFSTTRVPNNAVHLTFDAPQPVPEGLVVGQEYLVDVTLLPAGTPAA